MIYGSNLLSSVLTIQGTTDVSYYKWLSRTKNPAGAYISTYADPVTINGSLQPVDRKLYEMLGLAQDKRYYIFYVCVDIIDIGRNVGGDQIVVDNELFQCEQAVPDIFKRDGWVGMLCVYLSDATSKKQAPIKLKLGNFSGLYK